MKSKIARVVKNCVSQENEKLSILEMILRPTDGCLDYPTVSFRFPATTDSLPQYGTESHVASVPDPNPHALH